MSSDKHQEPYHSIKNTVYGPSKDNPPEQEELLKKSMETIINKVTEPYKKEADQMKWEKEVRSRIEEDINKEKKQTALEKSTRYIPWNKDSDAPELIEEMIKWYDNAPKISTIGRLSPLQEINNRDMEIGFLKKDLKVIEAKVLEWYTKTKDEEYRQFMEIQITTEGNVNQSNKED